MTIASGSFDTKMPLNINDADIDPESKHILTERCGVTDMLFFRIFAGFTNTMRQIMAPGMGVGETDQDAQSRLMEEMFQTLERKYLRFTPESDSVFQWVAVTIT